MTDPPSVTLREASGFTRLPLPEHVAAGIARLKIATVSPTDYGEWDVGGISKVGVVRLGETVVRIEPKVPIDRLFFLLSRSLDWDAWRDEDVTVSSVDALYPAIADLFARFSERVIRAGILRSYKEIRAAEPFVRGRWLVSEQIRKRHGLPLPAELIYDDFTTDIAENRLLRSASRRLLRFDGLTRELRTRLSRIEAQLGEAELLTRGRPLPAVKFDRRNAHYRQTLGLARLVLEDASLDQAMADVSAAGFLLNVPAVFERFIEAEVTRAAVKHGGEIIAQKVDHLDAERRVEIRPDLVWVFDGSVRAVFDAKYKAEKPAGYPNADIYQMLAYCLRHGVAEGHLIYAAGNEEPTRYLIQHAGVTVVCHVIALNTTPGSIMGQVDELIDSALGVATI